jgi:hypothetical protein
LSKEYDRTAPRSCVRRRSPQHTFPEMGNSEMPPGRWAVPPTAKDRSAAQRAVNALLDELAPERVIKRAEPTPLAVEQHRSPNGCVLQAPNAALSVSWFPDADKEGAVGELHIVVWRGIVSRRGVPRRADVAVVSRDLVLYPVEGATPECMWRAKDGTTHDTHSLTAHCLALLAEEISAAGAG